MSRGAPPPRLTTPPGRAAETEPAATTQDRVDVPAAAAHPARGEISAVAFVDGLVCAAIVVFSLAVWWPTRTLPYHWDSAVNTINASRRMLETNFHPLVPAFADFAHPPLLIATLALTWKIFGDGRLVSHLLMLPLLPILLVSTYGLGTTLANRRVAFAAAVVVACTPFVLAEYGMIYIDLPTGALATLALWLWFAGHPWPGALALTLAVMIKLPALVLVPALGLVLLADPARRFRVRAYLPLLVPPALAVLWLVYHRAVAGWWLSRPDRAASTVTNLAQFQESSAFVLSRFFLAQSRWVLLVLGIGSVVYLVARQRFVWRRELLALVVVLVAGLLFFILAGEYIGRYAIYMMPAYAILVAVFVDQAIAPWWGKAVVLAGVVPLLVLTWHPTLPRTAEYDFRFPEDLTYLDYIQIGREAAGYVEEHFRDAIVYGTFPETYQLGQPHQGYVTRPIEVHDCRDFKPVPGRTQLLYVHPYTQLQTFCRELLGRVQAEELQLFESNGKWIDLFRVVDAPRAG